MKRPDLWPYHRIFPAWTVILLVIVGIPDMALAHRVTVFAWVDGNTVVTQSRFSGGKAVQNGDITVYDDQGRQLLTGKTDAAGEFSFKLPAQTGVRIVLNAGMGHGNEWILSADEFQPAGEKRAHIQPPESVVKPSSPVSTTLNGLTREDIKAIIDTSIDKKLKPMIKMIAEIRNTSPSFTDILGGIGYIIGLVGLAAYVQSRKRR